MKQACTRFVIALLLLLSIPATSQAAEIWYQDNNLGSAYGIPDDFVEKFRQPQTFSQATKHIKVYMLRAQTLEKLDDAFFTGLLFPYLEKNNIKLALNSAGATWAGYNARREMVFQDNIALLERIKRLGGRVDYISLQSILSKPLRQGKGGDVLEFPMERRISGAVNFARAARAVFPNVAIGIIDALPSKGEDYKKPYRELADALGQAGIGLSYVHIDLPFNIIKSGRMGWRDVREVERYVESDLGVQFGLFITSRQAGQTSSAAFQEAVLAMLECDAGSGGSPRDYIVTSWFRYPQKTIPEAGDGTDYPMMRTVLDFARRLDQIQKGGQAWVTAQPSDARWMKQCGIGRPN